MDFTKLLGKSWQTSLGGVGSILGSIVGLIGMLTGTVPVTVENIVLVGGGISTGLGLLKAKSTSVTGIVTSNPLTTTATTDPAKDGTAPQGAFIAVPPIPTIV